MVDGVLIEAPARVPRLGGERRHGSGRGHPERSVLKKGVAELDPLVATVDPDNARGAANARTPARTAPSPNSRSTAGKWRRSARPAARAAAGGVPMCPENAIDLRGYTDAQITAQIDGLLQEAMA